MLLVGETLINQMRLKNLRGALHRNCSVRQWDFPCPLELSLGTMPLSSTISQLHIYCLRCDQLNLQTDEFSSREEACLVIHNLTGATSSPQWLSKVVMTRDPSSIPQMREQTLLPASRSDMLLFSSKH